MIPFASLCNHFIKFAHCTQPSFPFIWLTLCGVLTYIISYILLCCNICTGWWVYRIQRCVMLSNPGEWVKFMGQLHCRNSDVFLCDPKHIFKERGSFLSEIWNVHNILVGHQEKGSLLIPRHSMEDNIKVDITEKRKKKKGKEFLHLLRDRCQKKR